MNLLSFDNDRGQSELWKLKTNKQIVLNSSYATKITNSAGKNSIFRFNIRNILIDKMALLRVEGIQASGTTGSSIYQFRTTNLLYNNRSYHSSDNIGYPVILSTYFGTNNMYYRNLFGLQLLNQNIDYIELIVSDDITNMNAGIATDINFIMTLYLEILEPYKINELAPIPIKKMI